MISIDAGRSSARWLPTVTISRRGADRLRAGHPVDLSIGRRRRPTPSRATSSACVSERGRPLGWAFWSSASQISLRMLGADDGAATKRRSGPRRLEAALDYRDVARDRRHGLAAGQRRGRPAAGPHRRSLRRRAARGADADAGHGPPAASSSTALVELVRAARHPGAQRSESPAARRARRAGRRRASATCRTRRGPRRRRSATAWTSGTARRPGCSSTSARTTRRRPATRAAARSTRSPTTADSRCSMARRCESRARARFVGAGRGGDAGQRDAQRRHRTSRSREANVFDELRELEIARERVRHDRARPAGVRQEQGGGRRAPSPATRKSTCAR